MKKITLIIFSLLFFACQPVPQILAPRATFPAFPGAVGFGSTTPGGRGGTVYLVTNLNNSGPGSLRACAEASGPRICIFRVGGTITLTSNLLISNPYITIAGQTAPGGGVLIHGQYKPTINSSSSDGTIWINTHDVIIRGLRIRGINRTAIGLYPTPRGNVYNIIIDHNSMSWSVDTVADNWFNPHDITYSWNILAEPLVSHNYGMLIGGEDDCTTPGYNFTIHHNLFAHSSDRNPTIKQKIGSPEVVNNVVYNFAWFGIKTFSEAAIIGNQVIPGPNTQGSSWLYVANGGECPSLQTNSVYVAHNIGPGRETDTGSDWNGVYGSQTYQAFSYPFQSSGIVADNVLSVKDTVLDGAGAIIPYRDAVDIRVINEVKNRTGKYIAESDVVWPVIASGTPPADSDGDGLPDEWDAPGRSPSDIAPSGYTWIEEWANSFFDDGETPPTITPTITPKVSTPTFTPVPATKTPVPATSTPTKTATGTFPPTFTRTPTATQTSSITPTVTLTPTATSAPTETHTNTPEPVAICYEILKRTGVRPGPSMWLQSGFYLYPGDSPYAEYTTLNNDPQGLPDISATFACMGKFSCFATFYNGAEYARVVACP